MRLYIDACIWRDYYENRSDGFRPLGEWAFRLIQAVVACNGLILISDLLLEELFVYFSEEEVGEILALGEACIKKVETNLKQINETKRLSKERGLPQGDVLHAIIARDNCAIMVTRDKHFLKLMDVADVCKPEDLL